MGIRIIVQTESVKRDKRINDTLIVALQGINKAVSKLENDSERKAVYSLLLKRLDGRVSKPERRKAVTAYYKGARRMASRFDGDFKPLQVATPSTEQTILEQDENDSTA